MEQPVSRGWRRRQSLLMYPRSSPQLLLYISLGWLCSMMDVVSVEAGRTLTQQDIRPSGNTTLLARDSPYLVQQTLAVPRGAGLVIEPGVRLEFLPGTGLIVQGALLALGDQYRRILMTSREVPAPEFLGRDDPTAVSTFNDDVLNFHREVRLIRGMDPSHGQIQLFHKTKWRSVCTHSYNWTAEDIRVACVQLGFTEGLFDAWIDHANDTDYMLLQGPRCGGLESSLTHCPEYRSALVSRNICEGHPDMLIRCLRHSPPIQRRHWMGIHFANASYITQFPHGPAVEVNVTQSLLQHVDIFYAGSGPNGQPSSAIEAVGAPPIVRNCTIQFSAFNGLNFTHTTGAAQILESKFRWNKGHGIAVNSTDGNVTLRNVVSEFNSADGIYYIYNDTFLQLPDTFCTRPQLTFSQSYPLYIAGFQLARNYSKRGEDCSQRFFVADPAMILTVHFTEMEASDPTSGTLELRDGPDGRSRLLAIVPIVNGTRPESINTNANRLWIRFQAAPRSFVRFVIKIAAGYTKDLDVNITNSVITGNGGRGIAIRNMRSGLNVEGTLVRENGFQAGIAILDGAGDVNVSYSVITKNRGDGINVTYVGGRRNITVSRITENQKHGLAISFNETVPRRSLEQDTQITHSFIEQNWNGGVIYGNFCRFDHALNVTNTSFVGNQGPGVEVWSCLMQPQKVSVRQSNILRLTLEWNKFSDSAEVGLRIRPAVNIFALIGNNTFSRHRRGAIWIQNMNFPFDEEWAHLPSDFTVNENFFCDNEGPFVVLIGLTEASPLQKLDFRYNYIRDNVIIPASNHIRRHRSEGVVIVGSSNVRVNLNSFDNPLSPIWLATHSRNPATTINATHNWWGCTDEAKIYDRVFGGKDRYDLSQVVFRPYLSRPDLVDPEAIAPPPEYRKPFVRGNVVGGLYGDRAGYLSGEYVVESDLIIQPNAILTIRAGTRLRFEPGVGILSQGKIAVDGTLAQPVEFDLRVHLDQMLDFTNESTQLLRLVNGSSKYEGRLEIFANNEWSTVCQERWTLKNAGVVCRQLGFAHAPEDFLSGLLHYSPGEGPIAMSHVDCDDWDWDILRCPHDALTDHSCTHLQDVGVKCRAPGWAGLRLPITAEQSILDHAVFRRAGILDLDTQTVSAAVQIDFNMNHRIRNCIFEENSNAGLVILNNHLHPGNNLVQGARFRHNAGSGMIIRSPGVTVLDGEFVQNGRAAFLYDPKMRRNEMREAIAFLERKNPWRTVVLSTTGTQMNVQVDSQQEVLVVSSGQPHVANGTVTVEVILRDFSYLLGVQVLSLPQRYSTETMKIYNGDKKASDVEVWLVDERVDHLPATSVSYKLVLEYHSGPRPLGKVMILLTPLQRRDNNIPTRQFATTLDNCRFNKNERAIEVVHYDLLDQHECHLDSQRRFNNETIRIVNSHIEASIGEGLRVVNYQPWVNVLRPYENAEYFLLKSLAQINYLISGTTFDKNGAGVIMAREGFRNVEASGNIYQWVITKSQFTESTGPAVSFDFPISLGKRNYAMWDKRYMRAEVLRLEYERFIQKYWDYALDRIMTGHYDVNWMEREHLARLGYQSFHASTDNLSPYAAHSLNILNCVIRDNRNTLLKVDGDFLRFNFTNNEVSQNHCPPSFGLMRVSGTEKEVQIINNRFTENQCKFVAEFDVSSHTASTGRVPGNFIRNDIRGNVGNDRPTPGIPNTDPSSYAVAVKGLQRINVTFNILANPSMEYEFISGLRTERLNMELEVRYNYWGSQNTTLIRSRIFDFDDWNCYAYAQFVPFLATPEFSALILSADTTMREISSETINVLGGRLTYSLTLKRRAMPYVVNRDLTVMPGVTLTVEPGVKLEFFPNVGILVLGHLVAVGRGDEERIQFGPVTRSTAQRSGFPVTLSQNKPITNIRKPVKNIGKPVTDIGNVRLYGGKTNSEGYLEVLNLTTSQWIPIWHRDFSIRDGQVVCRHLGQPTNDVQMWRGPRVEDFRLVRTWMRPFYCLGTEASIHECELPLLEPAIHLQIPDFKDSFIFIRCQGRHISPATEYWGGIRFARPLPEFEDQRDIIDQSVLEDVDIISAGMLHGQKAAGAVEIINRNPRMEGVRIYSSASNGITVINPSGNLVLHHVLVENSVLTGVNILLLHGDAKTGTSQNSFEPIRMLSDPSLGSLPPLTEQFLAGVALASNVFGLVDICSADKVVYVQKQLLVLFRYDGPSSSLRRDCVKIFQIANRRNVNRMPDLRAPKIGFRLLEWNLHDSEYLPANDFLELFEGNVYNQTDYKFLTRINASDTSRQTFESEKDTLTVHLSTTVAPNPMTYGFIAEVVTLPPAYVGFSREAKLNLTLSTLKANRRGGFQLFTTGELNPIISLERCTFERNGETVFHNFSTAYHAALLDVQNTPQIELFNNNFKDNQGGLRVLAGSMSLATRMQLHMRGNLFQSNRIASVLSIRGRAGSNFQEALIHKNVFFDNTGRFTDNVILGKVAGNFSHNQFLYNTGRYNLLLDGFDRARSTNKYQTVYRNNFIRNVAFGRPELSWIDFKAKDRSTVYVVGSGQGITDNVFNNPDTDMDLHVSNQSELFPVDVGFIDARMNYWGLASETAIRGRIRDKADSRWLYEVKYMPVHESNATLMDGKCFPGFTLLDNSCYIYIGGVTSWTDALRFCKSINASLPFADRMEFPFTRFINNQQRNYDWKRDGVWIQSYAGSDPAHDQCVTLRNHRVQVNDQCDTPRPFICERDQAYVVVSRAWTTQKVYLIALIVALLAILLVIILGCCWARKSRQRRKEAFKRRDSIRNSIRISRSSLAFASNMNLNGGLLGPSSSKGVNLHQVLPSRSTVNLNPEPVYADSESTTGKSSRTFNSSVEISPDYDFFEARNDAIVFDPYFQVVRRTMRSHLTPSDLTFHNIGYIDNSSNSRTSTRGTDTASTDTNTIDVKPAFVPAYSDEEEEESPPSFRYYENVRRRQQLLETDM
ncbi:Protein bark beetle [Hypsibius exemplaris]|uniref:Protein bark beetle n=1 Tax=Hypsibius exemplaris TaxID=2072580 RepID=A0A1W0WNC0_HYPEX|nr:Protein bark beetle [Hypsibius exemplaris]